MNTYDDIYGTALSNSPKLDKVNRKRTVNLVMYGWIRAET